MIFESVAIKSWSYISNYETKQDALVSNNYGNVPRHAIRNLEFSFFIYSDSLVEVHIHSHFQLYSGGLGSLLEQMVEVLCRHVSDESSTVRRLCLRGLVQLATLRRYVLWVFLHFNYPNLYTMCGISFILFPYHCSLLCSFLVKL